MQAAPAAGAQGTAAGAGDRPYTDFLQSPACTHGNCDRRVAYLKAASDLLVSDLEEMVAAWAPFLLFLLIGEAVLIRTEE